MSSDPQQKPGTGFEVDLRLIREKRGISMDEIHHQTRIPVEVITQFERTGLTREPQFNEVYLRAFIRTYAGILGISADLAIKSLDDTLRGRYDGSLAVEYLGLERSDIPALPPPPPADDEPVVDREEKVDEPATVNIEHRNEPLYHLDRRPPPALKRILVVLIFAILVGAVVWVLSMLETEGDPEQADTVVEPEVSETAAGRPGFALGDTIQMQIIAADEPLSPIRVQVDDANTNPYWVEQGDTLAVEGTGQFVVTGNLAAMRLLINGVEFPLEVSVTERNLVLTRNFIQDRMQEQFP